MIHDIYEPLVQYRDDFREKFLRIAEETYEEFTVISGVDISANRKTVAAINKKKEQLDRLSGRRTLLGILTAFLWVCAIISLVYGGFQFFDRSSFKGDHFAVCICVLVISALLLFAVYSKTSKLDKLIALISAEKSKLVSEAWQQMSELNALFNWETITSMVSKCVPRLEFDPYYNSARAEELECFFGLNSDLGDTVSVKFVHSGVINDNPFLIANVFKQVWGTATYTGTKVISYVETVRDSDGKLRRETRYQTLYATVTKPKPEYEEENMVIYGNEAASRLNFSRQPSEHAGKDGFFNNLSKKRELKKLEKFARNLTDDSNFTMMSNKEFEVLFHADDRNDEVEFRVLFTPLAQEQMVRLLNDTEVGYGDDFHFRKNGMINVVFPMHLNGSCLDVDPSRFAGYSYDNVKQYFISRSCDFFKSVYFAFAPLLTIPLYQQTRTSRSIYRDNGRKGISSWESESFINYLGRSRFAHSDSITENILKSSGLQDSADGAVTVDAHGFKGIDRIELVPVYGNDGRWHNVPVPWVEYVPVCKTSRINVAVADESSAVSDTENVRRRIFMRS